MKKFKSVMCWIVMRVLFRALQVLAKTDSRLKAGIKAYPNRYVFRLRAGLGENAPVLSFKVKNDGFALAKNSAKADMDITIKSIEDAFALFTGQVGIGRAYAEHRFFLKGNPYESMGLVRALEIAESYLFPPFIADKLDVPNREYNPLKLFALMCVKV